MAKPSTTRRNLLGAMMIAPAAMVAMPAVAAPQTLEQAIDAVFDLGLKLNEGDYEDEIWDDWSRQVDRVLARVEALPLNHGNARIRAKAVWRLTGGELEDAVTGEATSCRLARQVLASMAA